MLNPRYVVCNSNYSYFLIVEINLFFILDTFLFKVNKKDIGQVFKIKKVTIKNIYLFGGINIVTHVLCLSKLQYYEQHKLYQRHNRHHIMEKG